VSERRLYTTMPAKSGKRKRNRSPENAEDAALLPQEADVEVVDLLNDSMVSTDTLDEGVLIDTDEDAYLSKQTRKNFAQALISRALSQNTEVKYEGDDTDGNSDGNSNAECEWDVHATALLIHLNLCELRISKPKKVFKFLRKCKVTDPLILGELIERNLVELSSKHIFELVTMEYTDQLYTQMSAASNKRGKSAAHRVFAKLGEAIEQGIIRLTDDYALSKVPTLC
jgi:hypothetical protein